jgi:manganese-dependent inorganic pyrophosphatase
VLFFLNIFQGQKLRVSVHETTSAPEALLRAEDFKSAMTEITAEEGLDEMLFFVVDILKEGHLRQRHGGRRCHRLEFGQAIDNNGLAVLPGVLSRKKQIMPALERA